MSQTNGTWCCDPYPPKVKNIMKEVDRNTEKTKKNSDLIKTVISVKSLRDDFYHFTNGTKVESLEVAQSTENSTVWKQQPIVAKRLKKFFIEAGFEQKTAEEREEQH